MLNSICIIVPYFFWCVSLVCTVIVIVMSALICSREREFLEGNGIVAHLFLVLSSRHQWGDSFLVMLVDISQWRAAIGCFRVFTCRSERFSYALSFFSVLLQILKLYQFAVGFILIAIVILPSTITVHFFIGHLVYARSCFLPLFSHSYSCIRLVSYILFELFKRIPFALNSLFRSKYRTIKYLFLAYFHLYAICIACNLLYSQWVISRMILLSGDVEPNPGPGPETLKFCCWNLNSITAHDFLRVSLIEAYNSIHNYDLIGIVETHLDDSISQERLALKGYEFITCNHQLNIKRGGVGLYIKDSLPKKLRPEIATHPESIVCELHIDRKKSFFVIKSKTPHQWNNNEQQWNTNEHQ